MKLTFPQEVAEFVRETYAQAPVILEYGSGGSTELASGYPDKLVYSVESDWKWAVELQAEMDTTDLPSPAILYHVDIGSTGAWGRPKDASAWDRFHRYPNAIWDEDYFRHPDVVLIDGRFRPACLAATCLRITRPVTVLFDDYVNRKAYHVVEGLVEPVRTVGRMAEFLIEPGLVGPEKVGLAISLYAMASFDNGQPHNYKVPS